jgi:hypothetical protein
MAKSKTKATETKVRVRKPSDEGTGMKNRLMEESEVALS